MPNILMNAHELLDRLNSDAPPKVLDASLPNSPIAAHVPDDGRKIPGSLEFDIEQVFSDWEAAFPHTLPAKEALEAACQGLGLSPEDEIVIYDNRGVYSSPRAYWLLTQAGFRKVRLLDGGLPHWLSLSLPVQQGYSAPTSLTVPPALQANKSVVSVDEVHDNIARQRFKVVDARSAARFSGQAPEPRPELPSGHIPGSVNLPFTELLENGHFKRREEIAALMRSKQLEPSDHLTFSCGSGITACIVWVAAELAGYEHLSLFDGSWTAWVMSGRHQS
ncbi:thiosulfate/3-mercaptopyruvate sulfurtransferase [Vreelandella songnenensis]|uniref:Thiosulfate/3-mercaptopyruvate sulfurtransferase n=1 Tax=Vreelandella songnenensis TaxID=1176243 RepID=A0A2T0V412_9GAMM|nr:sulfurtransferase [Halomonas songnenensis]PRY64926.1 thiosulfate/3-mercaptopyruvate sulfurtransferase [Halomonas songnenensis]